MAVTLCHVGHGVTGFGGAVHDGVFSTLLDETMGRAALRSLPARTGVTANLSITFQESAAPGEFYMVMAGLVSEQSTDHKAVVVGVVKDERGKFLAHASGTFVVPKKLQLEKIGDEF